MRETLCWGCAKCVGGCSWSHDGKPVKGWNAEKTIIPNSGRETPSYLVLDCPEFERDKALISKLEIARRLKVGKQTVLRWDPNYVIAKAKEAGFKLIFDRKNNCYYEID